MAHLEALGNLVHFVNKQLSDCSEMFKTFESLSEADPDKNFLNKEEAVSIIEEFNTHLVDICCCMEKQNFEYVARAQRLNTLASELEEEAENLKKYVTDLEKKLKPFGLKSDQPQMSNQPIFEETIVITKDMIVDDTNKIIDNVKIENFNLKSTTDKPPSSDIIFSKSFTPESPKCTANLGETTRLMLNMDFAKNMGSLKSKVMKSVVSNATPDSPEPSGSYFTPHNKKGNIFNNDDTPKTPELTTAYNFRYTQQYISTGQQSDTKYKAAKQVETTSVEPVNRAMCYPDTPESPKLKTNLEETKNVLLVSQTSNNKEKDIFGRNDVTPKTPELTSKKKMLKKSITFKVYGHYKRRVEMFFRETQKEKLIRLSRVTWFWN